MNTSKTARSWQLIDDLIDRAHLNWPGVPFVLRLPNGEEVLVQGHNSAHAPCASAHVGYSGQNIRPYCECNPVPRNRGKCSMHAVRGIAKWSEIPGYLVDLDSGSVSIGPSRD